MKRSMRSLVGLSLLFSLVAFCSVTSWAQAHNQFVYVNDDSPGPNIIEGFSVASNGALTALPGSPFLTGGTGSGGGFYAHPRTTLRSMGNFLYVSNDGSEDISIFKIDPTTGILTLSASGPVPSGGSSGGSGIGLAASPDGKFLFSGNGGSSNISAFSIGPVGGLAPVPRSPFAARNSPTGIIVTRDSRFVIESDPTANEIGVFAIAANGSLTPVSGSPFTTAGEAAGFDLDCSGQHLFVGDAGVTGSSVEVYSIGSAGGLTPISGSPFQPKSGAGVNSNNVVLDSTGHLLYVSNQLSATVTTFRVNQATSALSLVVGDPFPDGNSNYEPAGIAVDPASHFVFTANVTVNWTVSSLGVLIATKDGKLVQAPGSPFVLAADSNAQSLTAFPTKSCGP